MKFATIKMINKKKNIHHFKLVPLIVFAISALTSQYALSETKTDVTLSGLVGSDSNAHKLMDAFNPSADSFCTLI
ncbi:MAG: hypothetical protein Q9M92_16655 [Enterobacterales bacterium]|nr:hypothetical protein [Enterobacterales bacterium]